MIGIAKSELGKKRELLRKGSVKNDEEKALISNKYIYSMLLLLKCLFNYKMVEIAFMGWGLTSSHDSSSGGKRVMKTENALAF